MELVDFADRAARYAAERGARYCDVRAEESSSVSVRIEDGRAEHVRECSDSGIGVRIAGAESWGFASVSDPGSFGEVRDIVDSAIRGASRASKGRISLYDTGAAESSTSMPVRTTPDADSLVCAGTECGRIMSDSAGIAKSTVDARYVTVSKYFASSEGAKILQSHTDTIMEMSATAHEPGLAQSVNGTEGGRGGMEMVGNSARKSAEIAGRASELLSAVPAKKRTGKVVMNPDFVALLTHEIFGHPSEADRVLGGEMAWAGGAWWKGMLGKRIGSQCLTVYDDPTIPKSLGCYEYDDEGTRATRTELVGSGVLSGHMQSRETGSVFGAEPTGNMRAAGYGFVPLIRMACTCIAGGDHTPEEMIKGVGDGYLISDMKVPSIDMNRYNWAISCQYAHEIKGGQVGRLVRDIVVSGTAPDFFKSVDACGSDFAVRPVTNCGKGDPMQPLMMGNGGPSIRGVATVRSI